MEGKIDRDAQSLLAIIEQYGPHLMLKTSIVIYKKAGHQNKLILFLPLLQCPRALFLAKFQVIANTGLIIALYYLRSIWRLLNK